jgi:hypothetical protein
LFKLFPLPAQSLLPAFHVGLDPKNFFFHIKNYVKPQKFRRFFEKIAVLRPYLFSGPNLFDETSYTYGLSHDEHFNV